MPAKKVRCKLAEFCGLALAGRILEMQPGIANEGFRDSLEETYLPTLTLLIWFSLTFPMNCDCSLWAQSSPQTCSVPSRLAISSSQAHR